MTFGERMKEALDQGWAATKDIASKAGEKAQEWGEKSYQASKKILKEAGAKAQDLGERGVLKLEIAQLEGRAKKLFARLGTETWRFLAEQGRDSVSAGDGEIAALIEEIGGIKSSIEKREADLQLRRDGAAAKG